MSDGEPAAAETANGVAAMAAKAEQEPLPPLSDRDFKIYNSLADKMDAFHNHFRQTWTLLWTACVNGHRPRNLTLKQFLDEGLQFGHHLTAHHTIEERYFFPMLARRMPEFDPRRGDLIDQHRQIHEGLEVFEAYLRGCRSREHELDLAVLREKMESWGDILWTHLDQEVKTLGADNMRRYWSKDDMAKMPM